MANNLVVTDLQLVPLFEQITVYASFTGDDNHNSAAYVEWRPTGQSRWRSGVDLVPDRRANLIEFNESGADIVSANPYKNQFRGIIFGADGGGIQGSWLRENCGYDVRVIFVDPDGVTGSPILRSVTTLNSKVPSNGPVKAANASNYASVIAAAVAGDNIELEPGTYTGGLIVNASGQPNNYITIRSKDLNNKSKIRGGAQGMRLMGSYIRIRGLDISGQTGDPGPCIGNGWDSGLAAGNIIEQCALADPGTEWGSACVLLRRSQGALIQDNAMVTTMAWNRGQGFGVFFWETGNWGENVIRRNSIITVGTFRDGIGGSGNFQIEAGPGPDSMMYENYIEGPYDDGIESEGGNKNCAIFGNVVKNNAPTNENSMTNGIAMASVVVGPLYVLKNIINKAREGAFKQGSSSYGAILLYHNTSYLTHYGAFSSGNNRFAENQVARNNIYLMSGGRVIANYNNALASTGNNDYDYDDLFDSQTFKAFWYSDPGSYNTLAALQAINRNVANAFGQPVTGVERHAKSVNPQLFSPETDDFRLQATSPCIDAGILIPGINGPDSPWAYKGSAPDIGAIEYGSQTVFAPVADATSSTNTGVAPLTVQFTDRSTGEINMYLWSFGDGATSAEINPSHTYVNPGTYTATLTVTGPGGSDSITSQIVVYSEEAFMNIFGPGQAKTARAPVTVIPAGLNCSVELFLGVTEQNKAATSGKINFVSNGAAQNITFPITMPTAPGQYHVYIDVIAEGFLLVAFIATEDVIIPSGTVGPPVWS